MTLLICAGDTDDRRWWADRTGIVVLESVCEQMMMMPEGRSQRKEEKKESKRAVLAVKKAKPRLVSWSKHKSLYIIVE
jgi:hypothetical protein